MQTYQFKLLEKRTIKKLCQIRVDFSFDLTNDVDSEIQELMTFLKSSDLTSVERWNAFHIQLLQKIKKLLRTKKLQTIAQDQKERVFKAKTLIVIAISLAYWYLECVTSEFNSAQTIFQTNEFVRGHETLFIFRSNQVMETMIAAFGKLWLLCACVILVTLINLTFV